MNNHNTKGREEKKGTPLGTGSRWERTGCFPVGDGRPTEKYVGPAASELTEKVARRSYCSFNSLRHRNVSEGGLQNRQPAENNGRKTRS